MTEPSAGPNAPAARERSDEEKLQSRFYTTTIVTIYASTFVVLLFPGAFLASGIQAIGRERGWWAGDEMANDGEETFSTAIGLFGTGAVLIIAASLTLLTASKLNRRMAGAFRAVLIGSIAVIVGQAVLWAVLFTN